MKFRIIRYYERYQPQVFEDGKYKDIGLPNGYSTVTERLWKSSNYKKHILRG